jgi:hypothetical protein
MMRKIFFSLFFLCAVWALHAQTPVLDAQLYYNNPSGLSFIPPLSRPALVYQGRLYSGNRQLSALVNQLNQPEFTMHFQQYKRNKTGAMVLNVVGTLTALSSVIIWNNENNSARWWLLGGGIACSATGGVLNGLATQHLRAAAMSFPAAKQPGNVSNTKFSLRIPIGK